MYENNKLCKFIFILCACAVKHILFCTDLGKIMRTIQVILYNQEQDSKIVRSIISNMAQVSSNKITELVISRAFDTEDELDKFDTQIAQ